MGIQSTGVGSGLDVNSIITQLMAIENRPLSRLQQTANTTQTQLSSYGALKSRITALGDAAEKLAAAATWTKTKPTSSDAAALTVTSTDSAAPVNLQIEVSQLARAQSVATTALPTAASTVGTGSLMMADNKLIVQGAAGDLVIAEVNPKEYKQLAAAKPLSGECWTMPVLSNGMIYCRNTEGDLVALDVSGK